MNEVAIKSISLSQPSLEWLIAVSAFCVLFSLFLAWLATFIIYVKVDFLKKIFPSTHNLIRAHIDYLMMATLLGVISACYIYYDLTMPPAIIAILCFGVLYNPFGFIVKAMNPKVGSSDKLSEKIFISLGFLPATIGFGYASAHILSVFI